MGSMDCLTTVVGTLYFGTQEFNPVVAGLISLNLPTFIMVKLMVTVYAGLTFVLAEKALLGNANKNNRSFKFVHNTLRVSYVGVVVFLVVIVVNNIIVIINAVLMNP